MKILKIFFTLLALLLILSVTACSSSKTSEQGTGSNISNDGVIQYDIIPADPNELASTAATHKPSDGYDYKKESNVLEPIDENTTADGYSLTVKDEETKEERCIVSVYHEKSDDLNILEIDVLTKDASDADLDAAVKLVRELIDSSFEKTPMDDIDNYLPLSTSKIKALIFNNEQVSETVYGADTDVSISFEFQPRGGTLLFRIEA